MIFDITQGLYYGLGFCPVLFVFLALLSVLISRSLQDGMFTDQQRREESEYRRGFEDGLHTTNREMALSILNESIDRKLASLTIRPGRDPEDSGNASRT